MDLFEYFGENSRPFIRRVCTSPNKGVYFSAYERLFYAQNPFAKEGALKELSFSNSSGVYDFVPDKQGIWVSFFDGRLIRYSASLKELYSHDFGSQRINQLTIDERGSLWGYSESGNNIVEIDSGYNIKEYSLWKDSLINVHNIKQGPNEDIYISGSSKDLLFSKIDVSDGKLINLVTPKIKRDFKKFTSGKNTTVFDFKFFGRDTVLLATNQGLYRQDTALSKIELERNRSALIRSIQSTKKNNLWLGSERGLFYYDLQKSDMLYFYSWEGLPNSTIAKNGLAIDQDEHLWVATAGGLAYSQVREEDFRKLNPPKRLSVTSNSKHSINEQGISNFEIGANLRITYSNTDYPTYRTRYKFRIPEIDPNWTSNNQNNYIFFPDLNAGSYTVEVISKKPGYFWSDKVTFHFIAEYPWYFSNYALAVYFVIFVFVIIWIVYAFQKAKIKNIKKNEAELRELVDEKTKDLQKEKERVEELLEESENAKTKLQNANEIKEQLLSTAAHDLKNPLQAVLGYEFILEDDIDQESREIFESIFQSARKMLSIITEVLDTAGKDIEQAELKKENVRLSHLVLESVKDFEVLAKRKGQTIKTNLDDTIYCEVDRFWLTEATDNLISNAIKYSPRDSTIQVNLSVINGRAYIEVIDNGPGLSEEDREKLFRKFQRLSTQPTGGESSSGLGLFIVKYIVDKHNGEVGVSSQPGKGSNFYIKLDY